jgi:hypothetical protein
MGKKLLLNCICCPVIIFSTIATASEISLPIKQENHPLLQLSKSQAKLISQNLSVDIPLDSSVTHFGQIKFNSIIKRKLDDLPILNQADAEDCWAFSAIEAANLLSKTNTIYDVSSFIKAVNYLNQNVDFVPYSLSLAIESVNPMVQQNTFDSPLPSQPDGIINTGMANSLSGATALQYIGASRATNTDQSWMINGNFYKNPADMQNSHNQINKTGSNNKPKRIKQYQLIKKHNQFVNTAYEPSDFSMLETTNIMTIPIANSTNYSGAINTKYPGLNREGSSLQSSLKYLQKNNKSNTDYFKKALDSGYVIQIGMQVAGLNSNANGQDGFYNGESLSIQTKNSPSKHKNNSWVLSEELVKTLKNANGDYSKYISGGHYVLLVGYKESPNNPNDIIFEIRNSWGERSGIRGYLGQYENSSPENANYVTSNYLAMFMYLAVIVEPSNETMQKEQKWVHRNWINNIITHKSPYNPLGYKTTYNK